MFNLKVFHFLHQLFFPLILVFKDSTTLHTSYISFLQEDTFDDIDQMTGRLVKEIKSYIEDQRIDVARIRFLVD